MNISISHHIKPNDFNAYTESLKIYSIFLMEENQPIHKKNIDLNFIYFSLSFVAGLTIVFVFNFFIYKDNYIVIALYMLSAIFVGAFLGAKSTISILHRRAQIVWQASFRYIVGTQISLVLDDKGWSFRGINTHGASEWGNVPLKTVHWNDYLLFITPLFVAFIHQESCQNSLFDLCKEIQSRQYNKGKIS